MFLIGIPRLLPAAHPLNAFATLGPRARIVLQVLLYVSLALVNILVDPVLVNDLNLLALLRQLFEQLFHRQVLLAAHDDVLPTRLTLEVLLYLLNWHAPPSIQHFFQLPDFVFVLLQKRIFGVFVNHWLVLYGLCSCRVPQS